MYFDFRTYFKVIRLVLTDTPRPRRLAVHLGLLGLLTVWAVFNAAFLTLDLLLYPRIRRVGLPSPIFIVGNARSGTTLFHRLLCGDEGRFVYFRTWEIVFPSLVQKKIVRFLYEGLQRRFPGTHRRLVAWESRQLRELKKQHHIGIATPEEDEWIFLISFSSAILTAFFPYVDELEYMVFFEQRPLATRRRHLRFYRGCVQRQLLFHSRDCEGGDAKSLLSKNPAFVTKMRDLAREFPDARFVYLMRNPFETIPSLLKLLQTVLDGLGIESSHAESARRALIDGCVRNYEYAFEVMEELPPERFAFVEYRDLVADPKASVEKVYEKLQLPVTPAFSEFLAGERGRQRHYRSGNAYSAEEFGVDEEELERRLAPLIERFGYRPVRPSEEEAREML